MPKMSGIEFLAILKKDENLRHIPTVILTTSDNQKDLEECFKNHEVGIFSGREPFIFKDLTKNGIAVLRYDDRGTAKSEGDFKTATSEDFKDDVDAAYHYLLSRKDIETPIISEIYKVLFESKDPKIGIKDLMDRDYSRE